MNLGSFVRPWIKTLFLAKVPTSHFAWSLLDVGTRGNICGWGIQGRCVDKKKRRPNKGCCWASMENPFYGFYSNWASIASPVKDVGVCMHAAALAVAVCLLSAPFFHVFVYDLAVNAALSWLRLLQPTHTHAQNPCGAIKKQAQCWLAPLLKVLQPAGPQHMGPIMTYQHTIQGMRAKFTWELISFLRGSRSAKHWRKGRKQRSAHCLPSQLFF